MTTELSIALSVLVNFALAGFVWLVCSTPRNKRRAAAWLWARAKAQEEKTSAWRRIDGEARDYEDRLLRRAELEEPRLIQISSKEGA